MKQSVKKSLIIVCSGLALGLFFLFGNISRVFLPFQRLLFSVSQEAGGKAAPDQKQAILASRIEALQEENRDLKKIIKLQDNNPKNIPARFIGREIGSPTYLLIDQGTNSGVKKGGAVISSDGALVGSIIDAKDSVSTVRLITDSDSSFSAIVGKSDVLDAETPISGVVEGAHGLGIELRLVPSDRKLEIGDSVFTSGEEIGVPRGIPIGVISEISATPGIPLQTAILTPFMSVSALLFVDVINEQ